MFGIFSFLTINIVKIIIDIRKIVPNTDVFPSVCKITSWWVDKTFWRFPKIANNNNIHYTINEDFVYPNNIFNGTHNIITGIIDSPRGMKISDNGTSFMLYWNKNKIGRNENKIGWRIMFQLIIVYCEIIFKYVKIKYWSTLIIY